MALRVLSYGTARNRDDSFEGIGGVKEDGSPWFWWEIGVGAVYGGGGKSVNTVAF